MVSFTCPLCGGTSAHRLYAPLIRCAGCGLVCTDAQAVLAPAAELYGEEYFTERNAYLAQADAFAAALAPVLDLAAKCKPHGRLVDIGCGPGLLLNLARRRGYEVKGCDIAPWAGQFAREQGFDVWTGDLHSASYPTGCFDVAIVNHTLEHVPEPRPFLTEVRRILAPDGVLVVGVPNFAGLMAQIMRGRWAGLLPDQHLWHFTPQTLREMLQRTQFCVSQLAAVPHVHHHANPWKNAALYGLSWAANQLGRGDSLLAAAQPCALGAVEGKPQ